MSFSLRSRVFRPLRKFVLDMCNAQGDLSQGCMACLIDEYGSPYCISRGASTKVLP